jgi:hypothetical protein
VRPRLNSGAPRRSSHPSRSRAILRVCTPTRARSTRSECSSGSSLQRRDLGMAMIGHSYCARSVATSGLRSRTPRRRGSSGSLQRAAGSTTRGHAPPLPRSRQRCGPTCHRRHEGRLPSVATHGVGLLGGSMHSGRRARRIPPSQAGRFASSHSRPQSLTALSARGGGAIWILLGRHRCSQCLLSQHPQMATQVYSK